jgi:hypothetical protein
MDMVAWLTVSWWHGCMAHGVAWRMVHGAGCTCGEATPGRDSSTGSKRSAARESSAATGGWASRRVERAAPRLDT